MTVCTRWPLIRVIPSEDLERHRPQANTSLYEGVWVWSSLHIALHDPHLLTTSAASRRATKQKLIKDRSNEQGTHSVECLKACKLLLRSTSEQYFIAGIPLHAIWCSMVFLKCTSHLNHGCSTTVSLSFQIKCTLSRQPVKPGNLCIMHKEPLPSPPVMLPQLELWRGLGLHIPKICCQHQSFCRLNEAINDTFVVLLTS